MMKLAEGVSWFGGNIAFKDELYVNSGIFKISMAELPWPPEKTLINYPSMLFLRVALSGINI